MLPNASNLQKNTINPNGGAYILSICPVHDEYRPMPVAIIVCGVLKNKCNLRLEKKSALQ